MTTGKKTLSPRADFPLSYHPVQFLHFLKFNCSNITDLKTEFKLLKVVSLQKQTKNNDEKIGNHVNVKENKAMMNEQWTSIFNYCMSRLYNKEKSAFFFNFCDMYL